MYSGRETEKFEWEPRELSLCSSLSPDVVCVPGKRTGTETKHKNQNGFYSAFSKQHGTKVHCAMR